MLIYLNIIALVFLGVSWRDTIDAILNIDLVEILDRAGRTCNTHETVVKRFT